MRKRFRPENIPDNHVVGRLRYTYFVRLVSLKNSNLYGGVMNTIALRIEFTGKNSVLKSNLHKELKSILEGELGLPFELVSVPKPPNTMGGDLAVAIQALTLTVSSLALIWTIIVTRYRCSISIEIHYEDGTNMVIQKKALSERRLRTEMENFQEEIDRRISEKKVKEIIYRPES